MMILGMNTTSTSNRMQKNCCGTRELRRSGHVAQRENITQDAQKRLRPKQGRSERRGEEIQHSVR